MTVSAMEGLAAAYFRYEKTGIGDLGMRRALNYLLIGGWAGSRWINWWLALVIGMRCQKGSLGVRGTIWSGMLVER